MKKLTILLVFLVLLFGQDVLANAEENQREKHILIVNSYPIEHKWSNRLIEVLVEELQESPEEIHYHIEYRDESRDKHYLSYAESVLEGLKRYEEIGVDAILTIGYDSVIVVDELLRAGQSKIPLIIGGASQQFISENVSYPYINSVLTSYDIPYYVNALLEVQQKLSKVYFCYTSKSNKMIFKEEIVKEIEQRGINVEKVQINELKEIDFSQDDNQKVAMVVAAENWDDQGNANNVINLYEQVRQYYDGPVHWISGMQFYEILEEWQQGMEPISANILNIDQEAKNMAKNLRYYLEEGKMLEEEVCSLKQQVLFNYEGLKEYGLYTNRLTKNYPILNLPEVVISVPRNQGIAALVGVVGLFMILSYILHRQNKRKRRLLNENAQGKLHYANLLDQLSDGIIKIKDGEIEYINSKAEELLEGVAEPLVGAKIAMVFPQYGFWVDVGNGQGVEQGNFVRDGKRVEIEITWVDFSQEPDSRLVVIRDLTQEQQQKLALEQEEMKSQFFSTLSHEFRTPLNLILATSKVMEKSNQQGDTEGLLGYNQIIKYNGYRLTRIINDLIDTTKATSGFIELNAQPIDFSNFTGVLVKSIEPLAIEKGITVDYRPWHEPLYGLADHEKYERIILNLVMNGIKYNKIDGNVTVTLVEEEGMVCITVRDTGIGIPKEQQKDIFVPFHRANEHEESLVEGSGLGLSIVKSFVQLHEGNISLESVEGQYSQFVVRLPIKKLTNEQWKQLERQGQYDLFATHIEIVELTMKEVGERA